MIEPKTKAEETVPAAKPTLEEKLINFYRSKGLKPDAVMARFVARAKNPVAIEVELNRISNGVIYQYRNQIRGML